jgi:osmotically-inducible protein OsmY
MEPGAFPFVTRCGAVKNERGKGTQVEHNLEQAFCGVPVQDQTHELSEVSCEAADEWGRKWERRRDEEVRLAVMTALHWDLAVPRNCIEVTVKGGWVTLTGQVHRAYEKSRSEADALMAPGVVGVTNDIDCREG